MNTPTTLQPLSVHVIALHEDLDTIESLAQAIQEGTLRDIGEGLDWGVQTARDSAVVSKVTCLVYAPDLDQVLYVVRPQDITIH